MRLRLHIVVLIALLSGLQTDTALAYDNGLGAKPYLGWSSWSLEATTYPGYGGMEWLTAEHVKEQSDALHKTLQRYGYSYVNMDSGWAEGFDEYGRPTYDKKKFPQGIAEIAKHVHRNRQKLGIYWIPGISDESLKKNLPILGTPYHMQDIVAIPHRSANSWGFNYKIDYNKPGAQEYINSIAKLFASWGIDFLKFDGLLPDSGPDVAAWSKALKLTQRKIWLTLSWHLDIADADFWSEHANAWRIEGDIESYWGTLTGWEQLRKRFDDANRWADKAGHRKGWNDLDSLIVGSAEMDGITEDERRTKMTLWAIACSPLYIGDDLTKIDAYGYELLSNREVIAVDQAGVPAKAVVTGDQQVWRSLAKDGSVVVALFNLDGKKSAVITTRWSDIGLTRPSRARDLWSHNNLGTFDGSFSAILAPHACRLLRFTPARK